MRKLPIPALDHGHLFEVCAGQVSNDIDREQLLDMTDRIVSAGAAYRRAAVAGQLHNVRTIQMTVREKRLVRPLYDRRVADRSGAGRFAYEEIHSSADYCPFCSFGEVYEIDHFLPQTAFNDLNVLPINLIPICHPCNHIKRHKVPQGEREAFLHPYFDELPDVQWLFAEMTIQNGGPAFRYHVSLDNDRYGDLAGRLDYHFRELQLEKRFRRQAAAVLNELEAEVTQRVYTLDSDQIAAHLLDRAHQFAQRNRNSLETAAYFAASASQDYCDGSFRN